MSQLDDMSVLRCPECGKPLELGHDCLGDPPDAAKPRGWVPCLSCWLTRKFGTPYPKAHTGIGAKCPR